MLNCLCQVDKMLWTILSNIGLQYKSKNRTKFLYTYNKTAAAVGLKCSWNVIKRLVRETTLISTSWGKDLDDC